MSRAPSSIINFDTFFSEGREWKKFALKGFLLIGIPLLLLIGLLEFICWRTGEDIPLVQAARLQQQNPHLIFMSLEGANQAPFKLIRAAQERAQILILGQSRSAQFRSAMFRPYTAYNCGRLVWTFQGYADLLRRLPAGYNPKVIIFNLDFFTFNPLNTKAYAASDKQSQLSAAEKHVDALRQAFVFLYTHPWVVLANRRSAYDGQPSIGLEAALFGHGFRYDGSETQSIKALQSVGEDLHLLSTFRPNTNPLFYGDKMGTQEMADFEEFVRLAQARHSVLVGVQLPIYGPVRKAIEQDPEYGILKDFRAHLADGYFDRLGIIAFDETSLPPYDQDYHYFIDDAHPTEPISAAVILKMDEDPRFKAALPDLDTSALHHMLDQDRKARQHIYLYNYDF